jgi:hypothetical protein
MPVSAQAAAAKLLDVGPQAHARGCWMWSSVMVQALASGMRIETHYRRIAMNFINRFHVPAKGRPGPYAQVSPVQPFSS